MAFLNINTIDVEGYKLLKKWELERLIDFIKRLEDENAALRSKYVIDKHVREELLPKLSNNPREATTNEIKALVSELIRLDDKRKTTIP